MQLLRRPISASDRIPNRLDVISMEFSTRSRRRYSPAKRPQRRRGRRNGCFRSYENLHVKLSWIPLPSSGTTRTGKTCQWDWIVFCWTLQVSLLNFFFLFVGGTDYSKAFIKAFDLFNGTSGISGSSTKKVIIFLTDGRPNDNEKTILQIIKTKNAELNNEVVIMTYGMLANLPILRYIAEQEGLGVTKPSDVTVR